MAPRNVTQLLSNEADIQLAISSVNAKQIQGNRPAAAIYNVAEATLRRRRVEVPARRDYQPNLKKLSLQEEEVIVSHIEYGARSQAAAAVSALPASSKRARGGGGQGTGQPGVRALWQLWRDWA